MLRISLKYTKVQYKVSKPLGGGLMLFSTFVMCFFSWSKNQARLPHNSSCATAIFWLLAKHNLVMQIYSLIVAEVKFGLLASDCFNDHL